MARNCWIQTLAMLMLVFTTREADAQGRSTVIEWNRVLLTTLSTPGAASPTVFFTHPLAMVHVAVFEALNSIDRRYTPYLDYVNATPGASPDAAVAQAAHDVLSALFPTRRDTYAAALAADLERLPADAAEAGRAVGAAAARALLAHRANDGWGRTPPPLWRDPLHLRHDIERRGLHPARRLRYRQHVAPAQRAVVKRWRQTRAASGPGRAYGARAGLAPGFYAGGRHDSAAGQSPDAVSS